MSSELIGIIVTIIIAAIALAGLAMHLHRTTRDDIKDLREQVGKLRERTAGLQAVQDHVLPERAKEALSVSGKLKEDE